MNQSAVYIELEAIIKKIWLVTSPTEFAQQLDQLEKDGQITTEEHAALLKLYLGTSGALH